MNRSSEQSIRPLGEKCPTCGGEGKVPTRSGYQPCEPCHGSGEVSPSASSFNRGDVSALGGEYPGEEGEFD